MDTIVILGAKGMVGGQLHLLLPDAIALDRKELDVTDLPTLREKLLQLHPNIIINCVAYNDVDGAEANSEIAFKLNEHLLKNLTTLANELDALLVHFGTGYVFDDSKDSHNEDDSTNPLSVYAKSKLAGEQAVITNAKKYYVIRTNAVFGPSGESEQSKQSFVDLMLSLAEKNPSLKVVTDETNSITYAPDLARAVVQLVEQRPAFGIYHIINEGSASWYDFAKEIFTLKKIAIELIPVTGNEFPRPAKRSHHYIINNTKLPKLRTWQEALTEYLT